MATFGRRTRIPRSVTIEAWIIVILIGLTWWFLRSGQLAELVLVSTSLGPIALFAAGLLYSVFATVPLAVGAFLALAGNVPTWEIALWGGIGAAVADIILAEGVRSPLMNMLLDAVFGKENVRAVEKRLSHGSMRYFSAILGAALVAIPLPTDEEGIILMGASHLRAWQLLLLTFVADFVGIYVLVSAAQVFGG